MDYAGPFTSGSGAIKIVDHFWIEVDYKIVGEWVGDCIPESIEVLLSIPGVTIHYLNLIELMGNLVNPFVVYNLTHVHRSTIHLSQGIEAKVM